MKLSWKLFFITTPLFVLFLTIFGSWMIQTNFSDSLEQEIERCKAENQTFQNSYELTQYALTDEQREQMTTERIVESFYRGGSGNTCVRIYDMDGETLYESGDTMAEHTILQKLSEEQNVGYEIVRQGDIVYAVVVCLSSLDVYIETTQDITRIFEERANMYTQYQLGLLAMSFFVGGLLLLVLFLVMRNMQKLSRATRQFARGQYDTRLDIRSRDEIGMLAQDFNWMAGAMNTQMEQLKHDVQRQEEFTAAFAHELKTPLTSIIGYADMLRQLELSREETDMCADYIFRQGKRLQSLSYKLLDMTMANRQEIERRPVRMPQLLKAVERTVSVSLQEKSLHLYLQAEDGAVYGDWELLASVFINLIDNARKASEPGKSIWLTGERLRDGYRVTVEDEGGGLPQEELSKITQAFYMVDKSRARREGGAGLGLALCQKIIDLHQGVWQFESEEGQGLRITIVFPALPAQLKVSRGGSGRGRRKIQGRVPGQRRNAEG